MQNRILHTITAASLSLLGMYAIAQPNCIEIYPTDAAVTKSADTSTRTAPSSYAYLYNTGDQSVTAGQAISFSTNATLGSNFTHTAGSTDITVLSSGTYFIGFSVFAAAPNQCALFVNGTINTSTVYGTTGTDHQNVGQATLTLEAGDVITLVNNTGASTINLHAPSGSTIDADFLIRKVS